MMNSGGLALNAGIPDDEDLPRTSIPDSRYWSESFGHWGYFPAQNLGLFLHFQRHAEDSALWREIVVIQRGDGDVVVAKSYGRRADGAPSANGLAVTCVKPFEEWRIEFNGAARVVPAHQLWTREIGDGVHHPFRMSLQVGAFAPVWAMGRNANAESWGRAHYEQGVRIRGEICLQGVTTTIDGLGWRDHSYGTRDFAHMSDAQWMHGQFPSGRCFLAMVSAANPAGPEFKTAFIGENAMLYDATPKSVPPNDAPVPGKKGVIELEYARGLARIECTYLSAVPVSLTGVNEQVIGRIGGEDGWSKLYYDTSVSYLWDGEVGYGAANPTVVRPSASQ